MLNDKGCRKLVWIDRCDVTLNNAHYHRLKLSFTRMND